MQYPIVLRNQIEMDRIDPEDWGEGGEERRGGGEGRRGNREGERERNPAVRFG